MEEGNCAECKMQMGLLKNTAVLTTDISSHRVRGSLKCLECHRVYCFDCSDRAIPCVCGNASWKEVKYVPREPDPPLLFDSLLFSEFGVKVGQFSNIIKLGQVIYFPEDILPKQYQDAVEGPDSDKRIKSTEINTYLKERMRKFTPNKFTLRRLNTRAIVGTCLIGLVLWLTTSSWWIVLGGIGLGYVILRAGVQFAHEKSLHLQGLTRICKRCGETIQINADQPKSAWECLNCSESHFNYWHSHAIDGNKRRFEIRRR